MSSETALNKYYKFNKNNQNETQYSFLFDIYDARSRAIGCLVYGDSVQNFNISNIKYKNIRYNSAKPNKVASNGKANHIQTSFENVYANGYKITGVDSGNFEYDSYASITVK